MLGHMRATTEGCRALAAYAAGWQDLVEAADTSDERAGPFAMADFLVPLVQGFCTELSLLTTSAGPPTPAALGFLAPTAAGPSMVCVSLTWGARSSVSTYNCVYISQGFGGDAVVGAGAQAERAACPSRAPGARR